MSETSELLGTKREIISITNTAADQIRALMQEKELENHALRLFVSDSGCCSIQYGMAFEANPREDDIKGSSMDLQIVIDPISYEHLAGAKVEYIADPAGGGFLIENPNAASTCGCGNSSSSVEKSATAGSHHGGSCGCH